MSRFTPASIAVAMTTLWILGIGTVWTGTAQAEFLAQLDEGEPRLGRLVPSFQGGVVFEECSGQRWTIDGGDFSWTDKTCPRQASGSWSAAPPVPDDGGGRPKPKACPMCMEGPDLVDLMREAPGLSNRLILSLPALDAYIKAYTTNSQPPIWSTYFQHLSSETVDPLAPFNIPYFDIRSLLKQQQKAREFDRLYPLDLRGLKQWNSPLLQEQMIK